MQSCKSDTSTICIDYVFLVRFPVIENKKTTTRVVYKVARPPALIMSSDAAEARELLPELLALHLSHL